MFVMHDIFSINARHLILIVSKIFLIQASSLILIVLAEQSCIN